MSDLDAITLEYRPRVLRYLTGLLRNAADAEDVTQETLARVHREIDGLRAPGALTTWIFRIATRLAFDRLRSRAAHESRQTLPLATVFVDEDATGPSDGDPSSDEWLEAGQMAACLRGYVDRLPPAQRAALILRDFDELSEDTVAAILECSPGAVRVRTHRARRALRGMLESGCGFYDDARGILRCTP